MLNWWPFCLDTDAIGTLFTLAWDADGVYRPDSRSLFYNGYIFVRVTTPLGVWLHLRPRLGWFETRRFQCGFGWKLNGRFGLTLRLQTDASAARGVSGPNLGQASSWQRGTA